MERSDGISFDYRSEIWIALYHEQLSEDDKKNAGIIWRVPQRTILYHSKKKTRSSWFLTIRSMEYVWGSNGHRHGFCMIRHDVGFHSKHRNGHGQQHKRWGTYLYSYTIWTRTLNVGISDKYTWTLSRIEYDHMVLYCLEQRKTEKLGLDWKNLASLSKWFSVNCRATHRGAIFTHCLQQQQQQQNHNYRSIGRYRISMLIQFTDSEAVTMIYRLLYI